MARRRSSPKRPLQGELDAVLEFWNFAADLEARGFPAPSNSPKSRRRSARKATSSSPAMFSTKASPAKNADALARFFAMTKKAKRADRDIGQGLGASPRSASAPRTPATLDTLSQALCRGRSQAQPSREKKPTRARSTKCWPRSAAKSSSVPARRSIPETFYKARRGAKRVDPSRLARVLLLACGRSLRSSPIRAACRVRCPSSRRSYEEARSGALFSNLASRWRASPRPFSLAMSLGAALGYLMGRRQARRPPARSLARRAAQSAGARRHRARLYLGRPHRGRRDRRGRAQQAAERRRRRARRRPRARSAARRDGAGLPLCAARRGCAISSCRSSRPISRRRRARACRWSGRSCSSSSCSDAPMASASRSTSPFSFST